MPIILTDSKIEGLISETKPISEDISSIINLKQKHGHKERDIDFNGADGSHFKLMIRQSRNNSLDFSIILGYYLPNSNNLFLLRRYNGNSHPHTNRLEKNTINGFHVHQATERYQKANLKEEGFAISSNSYFDLNSALKLMLCECNFILPNEEQMPLF